MKPLMIALICVPALILAGCDDMTPRERTLVGVAGGAATGLILADALDANPEWSIVAALAGAAAGTMVARNTRTQQCAYAHGDGTYYTRPCP